MPSVALVQLPQVASVLGAGRSLQGSVSLRAGQDVVLVRRVADAVHDRPFSGERRVLLDVVGVGVKVGDALGDHDALLVVPRGRCRCDPSR
jgi:hypothetical protein